MLYVLFLDLVSFPCFYVSADLPASVVAGEDAAPAGDSVGTGQSEGERVPRRGGTMLARRRPQQGNDRMVPPAQL